MLWMAFFLLRTSFPPILSIFLREQFKSRPSRRFAFTWGRNWQDSKVKYKSIFENASPSSLREMYNSLWSRPKELGLVRKSRICIISGKEDNLQICEHFFLEISVLFDFHCWLSRIFGWMVRFSENFNHVWIFWILSQGSFRSNFLSNGRAPGVTVISVPPYPNP